MSGSEPCVVSAPVATARTSSAPTLTFDVDADLQLEGNFSELNATYAGMQIVKTGTGKLSFGGTVASTGNLTLDGGTLAVENGLVAAGLILAEDSALEIAAGKTALFGASSALAWAQEKVLTLVGAFGKSDQSLRFGTDVNGLTRLQAKALRSGDKKGSLDAQGWAHLLLNGFVLCVR